MVKKEQLSKRPKNVAEKEDAKRKGSILVGYVDQKPTKSTWSKLQLVDATKAAYETSKAPLAPSNNNQDSVEAWTLIDSDTILASPHYVAYEERVVFTVEISSQSRVI